eukprot:TRINITY_DN1488_c2_g1_i2.p1 TRINITY_DN1488_c2_g1~~TRINITY_DN1488_c2_g1_i2.p1  ORF type:complete len:204 (+),score=31.16 TRINITY_DN1488_c2_g1_i2:136-747(+)
MTESESIFQNKSSSFLESAAAMGRLSSARLTGYCCRILEQLSSNESGSPFTEQEEASMAKKLKVANTREVTDAATYIFQQFAYHNVGKEVMFSELASLEFSEESIAAIIEAWSTSSRDFLNRIRAHTLGGPLVLSNVTYDSQLQIADAETGPKHIPNSVLQLHLSEDGEPKEKVTLNLNHDQLYKLFKDIDTIQGQIDGIAGR